MQLTGVQEKQDSDGLLPVMVGYDCSQSSDTYSVAHQVDFLTQEIFHPATRSTPQYDQIQVRADISWVVLISLTFH